MLHYLKGLKEIPDEVVEKLFNLLTSEEIQTTLTAAKVQKKTHKKVMK